MHKITGRYLILALIIVISLLVRLYKIDAPVADWHSWRQADTAAVSRNFFKEGYNPLIPRYDDMSGVSETRESNLNRYRFVEFPIYNSLVYFAYIINNGVDERIARMVSILLSLGSVVFLFLIVRRIWGVNLALLSAAIFGILPFNVFFSRTILPEPSLVFFSLGMFYFVYRWLSENNDNFFFLSTFFTAMALLTKPYAIFYLLPLIVFYIQREGLFSVKGKHIFFVILSLLPFVLWRIWMSNFPEGIPASNWLFNGDGIRYKLVFWKWILSDRLGREILTVPGTVLFFLGLLIKTKAGESRVLHWLALSLLFYLLVLATGNVTHDYYQVLIVPALSIFLARGIGLLVSGNSFFIPRIFTIPAALLFSVLIIYLSWGEVKELYKINNPSIVEAGKFADKILPGETKVVAPYGGDTAFLYQTNRAGLAFIPLPLDQTIKQFGIQYYISVNHDAKTNWVIRNYKVLENNPKFVIADLTEKKLDNPQDIEPY